jgi:hypothetical protein
LGRGGGCGAEGGHEGFAEAVQLVVLLLFLLELEEFEELEVEGAGPAVGALQDFEDTVGFGEVGVEEGGEVGGGGEEGLGLGVLHWWGIIIIWWKGGLSFMDGGDVWD